MKNFESSTVTCVVIGAVILVCEAVKYRESERDGRYVLYFVSEYPAESLGGTGG